MAHSRNSDKSNHDAASQDEPRSLLDDIVSRAESASGEKALSGGGSASFADIEQRAAALAARLGGGASMIGKTEPIGSAPSPAAKDAGSGTAPSEPRGRRIDPEWKPNDTIAETAAPSLLTPMGEDDSLDLEPPIDASIHEDDFVMDDIGHVMLGRGHDVGRWHRDEHEERYGSETEQGTASTEAPDEAGGDPFADPAAPVATVADDEDPVDPNLNAALMDVSRFLSRRTGKAGPQTTKRDDDENSPSIDAVGGVRDAATERGMQYIAQRLGEALHEGDEPKEELGDLKQIEEQIGELTRRYSEANDIEEVPEVAFLSEDEAAEPSQLDDGMQLEPAPHPSENVARDQDEYGSGPTEQPAAGLADEQAERHPAEAEAPSLIMDQPASSMALPEVLEARIETLERQVVQLIDELARTETRLSEATRESSRREHARNSHFDDDRIVELSSMVDRMSGQIERLEAQSGVQETHSDDSLDALYDALKDLSDRMNAMEQSAHGGGPIATTAGGIASSVMTARLLKTQNNVLEAPRAQSEPVEPGAEPPVAESREDDALPIWLDDRTPAYDAADLPPVEEPQADVFSAEAPEQENSGQPEHEPYMTASEHSQAPERQPASHIAETAGRDAVLVGEAPVAPAPAPAAAQEAAAPAEWYQQAVPQMEPQAPKNAQADFLHHARAIAQASNQRLESETNAPRPDKLSSALEAPGLLKALREAKPAEVKPANSKTDTGAARKSLFSKDAERPNMIFVFTTLVLLGTSAMLLYGMVRNGDAGGDTTRVNAIEKPMDKDVRPALPAEAEPRGDQRSALEPKQSHRLPQIDEEPYDANESDEDYAKRVAALAPTPSPVDVTGALPSKHGSGKPSSLFDEMKGFAGARVSDKTGGDLAGKLGTMSVREKAAAGEAAAQFEIGRRHQQGAGAKKDMKKALDWYRKASKAGYAPAIYRLATFHERGVAGLRKDAMKAAEHYLAAAKKGNVKAMHNLGVLYTSGKLGKPDFPKALNWYKKAAAHGIKDSQFNTAIIFQNGLGVPINELEAYFWYSLAARAGDREAVEMRLELKKSLGAKVRLPTDKRLSVWKPRTADRLANAEEPKLPAFGQAQLQKQ